MTQKQKRKLANEIFNCEKMHNSETASREEKMRADKRILQLTNQIMALKDGINIMLEIDAMITEKINKSKENDNYGSNEGTHSQNS